MCPNRDKVTGRERNLQGSSSSHGAAPGAQYVPSGAARMRKESARQFFPSRLCRGPGMSLSSSVLLLLGFLLIFRNIIYSNKSSLEKFKPFWKCS